MVSGVTRLHATRQSTLPRAAVSAPLRRVVRPRTRLVRKLGLTEERRPEALASRLNVRQDMRR